MASDEQEPQSPPRTPFGHEGEGRSTQVAELEIDWSDEPAPIYANGAQLVHSHREFAIAFTEHAGFPKEQGQAAPKARVVASIRIPPDVFFQLAAACGSNWNQFVNRFGDPRMKTPKLKLTPGAGFQLEGLEPPEPEGNE